MKIPYAARIMACLPGHEPIEVARFPRQPCVKEYTSWTLDMSPLWEIWIERPLLDRATITRRPEVTRKPAQKRAEPSEFAQGGVMPAPAQGYNL